MYEERDSRMCKYGKTWGRDKSHYLPHLLMFRQPPNSGLKFRQDVWIETKVGTRSQFPARIGMVKEAQGWRLPNHNSIQDVALNGPVVLCAS